MFARRLPPSVVNLRHVSAPVLVVAGLNLIIHFQEFTYSEGWVIYLPLVVNGGS